MRRYFVELVLHGQWCELDETLLTLPDEPWKSQGMMEEEISLAIIMCLRHPEWKAGTTSIKITEA